MHNNCCLFNILMNLVIILCFPLTLNAEMLKSSGLYLDECGFFFECSLNPFELMKETLKPMYEAYPTEYVE